MHRREFHRIGDNRGKQAGRSSRRAEEIVVELTLVPASDAPNTTKPTTFPKDKA